MAQDTTPAIVIYQGDGSNNVFSVPFDKGYYGEVKVLFVRRGLADYTYFPDTYVVNGRLYAWVVLGGSAVYTHTPNPSIGAHIYTEQDVDTGTTVAETSGITITVNNRAYARAQQHDISNNLLLTWTGETLEVGDFVCIVRETERGQPYVMPNNQKHIERALDNIERQVQELQSATDSALKVDPSYDIEDSHKMNPIEWLETILRCMDKSVRAFRYANGWLDYSLDDPNIADADKTWTHLVNTANVKSFRDDVVIDPETSEEKHTLYYTDANGVERPIKGGISDDEMDNLTLVRNASDKWEATATVNHNSAAGAVNPVYDWVGTTAEYEAQDIATEHPDWLCFITDDSGAGNITAADVSYDNPDYPTVKDALDKLLYVMPSVTITGGGNYEIGLTISSVALSWVWNKTITSQSLNQGIGTLAADVRSYTYSNDITTDTTFTITGSDGTNSKSASTSVKFMPKRYWGVSTETSLTDAQIIALSSELSTSRQQKRTFDCSGGKYFYFAIKTSYCTDIAFKVGGLAFSDMVVTTRQFTNASGHTDSYNIYRVNNIQTGSAIQVEVL